MSDNRCPTCVNFSPMDDGRTHGLCRKVPPVVISRVETVQGVTTTKAHTSFPYVRSNDWCSEHELDTSL